MMEVLSIPLFLTLVLRSTRSARYLAALALTVITVLGGMGLLAGSLVLFGSTGTLAVSRSGLPSSSLSVEAMVGALVCLSLVCKLPVFPLYLWLPWVHGESSTTSSVLLAGVVMKVSVYGLLVLVMPLHGA